MADRAQDSRFEAAIDLTPAQALDVASKYFAHAFRTAAGLQHAVVITAAIYYDPILGPLLQRHGSLEEGLSRIPRDPMQFAGYRELAATGVVQLAAMAKAGQVGGIAARAADGEPSAAESPRRSSRTRPALRRQGTRSGTC